MMINAYTGIRPWAALWNGHEGTKVKNTRIQFAPGENPDRDERVYHAVFLRHRRVPGIARL